MALTDAQCRAARPAPKVQKISDGRGLFLQVTPGGSKLWRMNYRWQDKQRTAAFGSYPEVSLATARLRAAELKDKIAAGIDPAARATTIESALPYRTFEAAAKEWFRSQEARWVSGYAARIWSRLEADVFPKIGKTDVGKIVPSDVLALLREVEGRNALEIAKRLRQTISAVSRYAVANGWATHDPAAPLAGAMRARPRQQHRAALKANELPVFFNAVRAYSGELATAVALKLIAHTFVRSAELRLAKWSEFDGDLWRIPADRMKSRKEHLVPLSKQTKAMFAELRDLGGGNEWVLPGQSGQKPASENLLIYGLYRCGFHSRATVHGFRGTASTILNESGLWRPDAIERQLAHVPANEVRASYNSAMYLDERKALMQWYSDELGRLEAKGKTDLTHLLS